MRRTIALFAVLGLIGLSGCESWNKDKSSDPKMMSSDVCAHCPGVQTANADGKCPVCSAKKASASDPKMLSADVCSHCPGTQVANSEGKCPMCTGKK